MLKNAQEMRRKCSRNAQGKFECECGLMYKHKQSYNRHKDECSYIAPAPAPAVDNTMIMMMEFMKLQAEQMRLQAEREDKKEERQEEREDKKEERQAEQMRLQAEMQNNTMRILAENIGNKTINNRTNNFNTYLNEDCKHAKNITDIVKGIPVPEEEKLDDVLKTDITVVTSQILIDEIKELPPDERPIQFKSKTNIALKDKNEWISDKETIKHILSCRCSNIQTELAKTLNIWKDNHPERYNCEDEAMALKGSNLNRALFGKVIDTDKVYKYITKSLCN